MNAEYDLSKMKSRPNPYARALKQQVTLRVRPDVIAYFKDLATETAIPYQTLINLYLQDCMRVRRRPDLRWPHRVTAPRRRRGARRDASSTPAARPGRTTRPPSGTRTAAGATRTGR